MQIEVNPYLDINEKGELIISNDIVCSSSKDFSDVTEVVEHNFSALIDTLIDFHSYGGKVTREYDCNQIKKFAEMLRNYADKLEKSVEI